MSNVAQELGRLQRVDLREVWASEAVDFTPWLAREYNIALLGDTIGLDLEVEALEKEVGPFRADILCQDTANGNWVVVENQLERTDHSHLGQLLTYAAGLNAVSIVWIAHRFTEEHRATLDWLNDITSDDFNFFGLEVELWRIGNSAIAPKFNMVSKPNDWTRTISSAARSLQTNELTETRKLQLEYWQALRRIMEERGGRVKPTKPPPQHWQTFAVGRTYFQLNAFANSRDKRIGIQLVLSGETSKPHFFLLRTEREVIEGEIGEELEWNELEDKKESHVNLLWHACDPLDRSVWPQQHDWLYQKLQCFHLAFSDRVKRLDARDWTTKSGDSD